MAQLNLDVTGLRERAYTHAGDTDRTNPGQTDAQYLELLNEALYVIRTEIDPRVRNNTGVGGFGVFAAATKRQDGTPTNISKILHVHREAAGTDLGGPEMEWVPYSVIIDRQNSEPTQGTPSVYHAYRRAGAASNGVWTLLVHPIPDNSYYFSTIELVEPEVLVNAGDTTDLAPALQLVLARVAGAWAAARLEQPAAFIDRIWQGIPERQRAIFGRVLSADRRKATPEEPQQ